MQEQKFADGVQAITMIAGAVRLEMFAYSPTGKDAEGQPLMVSQYSLVLPLPGFLQMTAKMQEAAAMIGKIGEQVKSKVELSVVPDTPPAEPAPQPAPQAPQPPKTTGKPPWP